MPPGSPRVHGISRANVYASTMRMRAWMFCNARFSVLLPPYTLYTGRFCVANSNTESTQYEGQPRTTEMDA